MKEYKYLYQAMLSEKTIRKAYKNLRKGKTRRAEVKYIDAHLDDEVQKMHDMILNTKPDGIEVQNPKLGFKPHKHTPKIIYISIHALREEGDLNVSGAKPTRSWKAATTLRR